mgnify:CR=1 FL=1
MNILVINGSPSGQNSITLQTIRYFEKKYPSHKFEVLDVGQKIKQFEKDFALAKQALETCDLVLFCYPVYTFIATSQVHIFIRLIKENNVQLTGKPVSQVTTSKHFYDITAHNYVMENCQDLGMNYIAGLSADMDDLLCKKGQKQADDYFKHLVWCVENKVYERPTAKVQNNLVTDITIPQPVEKQSKTVVILRDSTNTNSTLEAMIKRFEALLPYNTKVVDLGTYPFKSGCIGCFHCAPDGKCIFKDNFDSFLRNEIQTGSSIVFAFNILDHSMGPRFKVYDDRQFCNGHRTVTSGMPMGYLITGNLDAEPNLKTIIDGRGQVGGNYIAGIATNQENPDLEVENLAKNLTYALENGFEQSSNFLGVGGTKIFRDLIYLMQGFMKADHKFYKAHGIYDDFPQKHKGTILKMKLVGLLINNPKIMAKAGDKVTEGLIDPYKKVLDSIKTEE